MFPSHIDAPKSPHLFYPSVTCVTWPPAPFKSCYLARNLKEVARAWPTASRLQRLLIPIIEKTNVTILKIPEQKTYRRAGKKIVT